MEAFSVFIKIFLMEVVPEMTKIEQKFISFGTKNVIFRKDHIAVKAHFQIRSYL